MNPDIASRPQSTVVAADHLVLPDRIVEPGWVEVAAGRIVAIGASLPTTKGIIRTSWLSAGFVDLHCHGGGGAVFQSGSRESVATIRRFQLSHGTTSSVASLVTAPLEQMADAAAELAEHVHDGLVEAIHFEGPFLSPARRGAHDPSLLREPEPQAVKRLIDACHGAPFMFTIAPELPGAMRAIRAIVESGGVAAIGHTNATYDLAVEAVKAGASVATHLFNAMPPVHHRNPGAIVALVQQERVVLELINDGEHVDKALVRCLLAGTKPGRIALVSDAMAAAGMADGIYRVGGLAVEVKAGIARLQSDGSLAGSTLTVDASLRRAIAAGLPAFSVFVAATATPARAIGIHGRVGSLEVGRRADLVLLEEDFQVQGVMTGGDWTVPVGPPAADGREHRQGANG